MTTAYYTFLLDEETQFPRFYEFMQDSGVASFIIPEDDVAPRPDAAYRKLWKPEGKIIVTIPFSLVAIKEADSLVNAFAMRYPDLTIPVRLTWQNGDGQTLNLYEMRDGVLIMHLDIREYFYDEAVYDH